MATDNASEVTLGDLVPAWQELVHFTEETTVKDALELLRNQNISSAPVLTADRKACHGLVDALDLVAFMVKLVLADKDPHQPASNHLDEISYLRTETFRISNVRLLCDFSRRNPFHTMPRTALLSDAIPLLATGVHRILLTDGEGRYVAMLSQSDIVRYLYQDPTTVFEGLESSAKQLGLADGKKVVVVNKNTRAIDAFILMHQMGLTNVAIVDPVQDYKLVGTFSASDVRILADARLVHLKESVSSFLFLIPERKPLITIPPTTPLRLILRKLAQHWVHRIYVIDEKERPVGIITLTDVIGILQKSLQIPAISHALIPYEPSKFALLKAEKDAELKAKRAVTPQGAARATGAGDAASTRAPIPGEELSKRLKMAQEAEKKRVGQPEEKKAKQSPHPTRPEWMQELP
jgi:CBS domain-containing protein